MAILVTDRLASIKESAIRRFIELASKSPNAVHFEHGEPNFATPSHIIEASIKAMKDGSTHYGPTPGLIELRKAISEKLVRENKLPLDGPEGVLVVSGTQESMFLTAMTFLQAGDEALVLGPYYPAYFEAPLLSGGSPVEVPLGADNDYRVEAEQLEKHVTRKTKMIWLNTPANPTGHVFSKTDLETIAAFAERNNLLVFSDEVYEKFLYDGAKHESIAALPGMRERVVTANGFSKTYAMTGWRVGYMAGDSGLIAQLSKLHYYTVLCANTIAQKAALVALTGPQDCVRDMASEYARRRTAILKALDEIEEISYSVPTGAFYVFPNISKHDKDDERMAEKLLRNHSVATVPGSGFGEAGRGHLRISYSVSLGDIVEGMSRFLKAFGQKA